MFFKEKTGVDFGHTPIDNIFLDLFMPMSNGVFVMVYLFAYRYACEPNPNVKLNNETIAKHLSIPLLDVLSAWDYWESKGIIVKHEKSHDQGDFDIEFVDLKRFYMERIKSDIQMTDSSKTLIAINENDDFSDMFKKLDMMFGRELTPKNRSDVLSMMEKYKCSTAITIKAFSYAIEKKNIRSIPYVASILQNWYDKGLTKEEDVDDDMEVYNRMYKYYKTVYKNLGLYKMEPTPQAKEFMDFWFNSFEFSLEIILKACSLTENLKDRAPLNLLSYMDSILKNWFDSGVKTIEDAEKEIESFRNSNQRLRSKKESSKKYDTKLHNFDQRISSYSDEDFEKLLFEKQKKEFE